ncbi:phage tail protein [Oenococcus oeni]|uniref:DUF806 family protein n=3 Tax=Oenococcus oeni TaxID=1247 RepID=UPI000297282F|nr:DUF806 family protein [Oenococcus oeni]EKP90480.1 putative phage tail component [Oenococcus oeni AWRIB202]OIK76373.1 phage tail protein [Oenococcus oeni]OIK77777.1 phage tail protein [Oenococcus oeni]OIL03702.1 phage tail protein [Oenococcus oeni]OIL09743.1 phage tail protein [Oenococcus oeni]
MSSVSDAVAIIKTTNLTWIDNVYPFVIPEEHLNDTDSTDCLVTENENSPTTYGDNEFKEMNQGVEIRLFYSLDFSQDADDCEIALMQAFNTAGWQITNADARYTDPDTGQAIKAIYVSHNKLLGGS